MQHLPLSLPVLFSRLQRWLLIGLFSSWLMACGGGSEAGATGNNGLNALLDVSTLAPGATCPTGGNTLRTGLDANRNGVLEASEVSATQALCNGSAGAGPIHSSLIALATEPAGSPCSFGGTKITVGLDLNDNRVLESSEVTDTSYVCNGTPALLLVEITPQTATVVTTSTQQFALLGTYVDGSTRTLTARAQWATGSSAIATVDSNGVVRGITIGTTTISASVGNFSISAVLTVIPFIFDVPGAYIWTVPAGITSIEVITAGAGGGNSNGLGGSGALLRSILTVTPASTLSLVVGGAGVSGGNPTGVGSGGGGASSVNAGLPNQIIAGGGGGGGVAGSGGNAGSDGTGGQNTGGKAGSSGIGGAGGVGFGTTGVSGNAGGNGNGGSGGNSGSFTGTTGMQYPPALGGFGMGSGFGGAAHIGGGSRAGGGGGGGFGGGGGGADGDGGFGGGGGGGYSVAPAGSSFLSANNRAANGYIIIYAR